MSRPTILIASSANLHARMHEGDVAQVNIETVDRAPLRLAAPVSRSTVYRVMFATRDRRCCHRFRRQRCRTLCRRRCRRQAVPRCCQRAVIGRGLLQQSQRFPLDVVHRSLFGRTDRVGVGGRNDVGSRMSALSSASSKFRPPSTIVSPVSTLMRRLVPSLPMKRRRSATGLKSTDGHIATDGFGDGGDDCRFTGFEGRW